MATNPRPLDDHETALVHGGSAQVLFEVAHVGIVKEVGSVQNGNTNGASNQNVKGAFGSRA